MDRVENPADEQYAPDRPGVLVLGASGYVGGRLVPELLREGLSVRCMSRSPESIRAIEWGSQVDVRSGDLLEPDSLDGVFDDIDVVFYLVHSLDTGEGFDDLERRCAANARNAAEAAGVARIVYLSGLGADDEDLSPHLRSRHEAGRELAAGSVEVIELRAAIVLGAGSASFEMLRSLVEVLPVMVTPSWVSRTTVQPIAISDVLTLLLRSVNLDKEGGHRIIEIGGPDRLSYREMIDLYAEVAGLSRRRILPLPVVTPGLSAHWVNLVTPLPRNLSTLLVGSLSHDVVVTDDSLSVFGEFHPVSARVAVERSIAAVQDLDIPTRWSGVTSQARAAQPRPWDPEWSGGTVLEDRQEVTTSASTEALMNVITGVGGRRGWYGFGPLWQLRGLADKLVGGVGLRRGRRHPDEIHVGEALDFWRVEAKTPDLFRLRAEMKLPGKAWLEWSVEPAQDLGPSDAESNRRVTVVQRARFVPSGLAGRAYWYALIPFHAGIFPLMLRRLVAVAEQAATTRTP